LRIGSRRSLDRLDELTRELTYVPMATSTWRAAAKPTLRRGGTVTAAPNALDGDVLTLQAPDELAVVAKTCQRSLKGTSTDP
jgi:hypothetical protein